MQLIIVILVSAVIIKNILASLGGGKHPDIANLLQLGAGLFGKGGGAPFTPAVPPPAPAGPSAGSVPAPAPAPAVGPSNVAIPDYSDYEGETNFGPSPIELKRQREQKQRKLQQTKQQVQCVESFCYCQMFVRYVLEMIMRQPNLKKQRTLQERQKEQQKRLNMKQMSLPPPGVTDTPKALTPPSSLTWMKNSGGTTQGIIDTDYEAVGMSAPQPAAAAQQPPPPPSEFAAVGHNIQRAPNPVIYHKPNARTFVAANQATLPPIRITPQIPSPQQPEINWNWAPPTAQPIVPTVAFSIPTLPPPEIPRADPQLLAHNTARMIREIASFSDVHHGANDDYGAVQKLMEAFFEAVADPKSAPLAQKSVIEFHFDFKDPVRVMNLLKPQYDGTELGPNRPLTNKLFESDMVLTVEQMKGVSSVVLASKAQRQGGLRREQWRNLIRSALKQWEHETCVRWEENGRGKDHVIFFRGSGLLSKICLQQKKNEHLYHKYIVSSWARCVIVEDYKQNTGYNSYEEVQLSTRTVQVFNPPKSKMCYSSVGRTGGSQMISIGYGCEDVCFDLNGSIAIFSLIE
ncbi:hypothetical protein DICVIV_09926 [Dictyocaulus viviparus]|uniref:Peptidase M12A domain-containing protein n=1 Tax=Dictyocaulus viviparus TaxID=29172 RepID=A0A0D8XHB0_DICVI|nr:hypothetical protein DICVIV_09926 [Dictyocaulus viviparus]